MATDTDIDHMLSRTALGDREAFARLYEATSPVLYGTVLRVLADPQLAEDTLYETYLKIHRYADRYAPNNMGPMSWLATIARNTAIDRRRVLRDQGSIPNDANAQDLMSVSRSADVTSQHEATPSAITLAMRDLADDRRAAVRGAYLGGFNYTDLSEKLDVPVETMQAWLRKSLHTILGGLQK